MERIILKADLILHGRELDSMEKGSIVIENGRILDILPQHALADFPIADACELSFPGQTLMPGMIECHNHLCIDATLPEHLELLAWSNECQLTILALKGLEEDLLSGVTTARCLGDKYYIDTTMKKLIEDGKATGPRLLAAGTGMKGSHGAGYIGSPHCGTEEIRNTCRQNLKRGVDLLKLFVTPGVPDPASSFVPSFLSLEEISMAVSEGARLGVPVAAHCIGGQGLKDCIDGGVKVIEHMYMATEQDVEWLAASDCVVDLTSGIFLDSSREAFLSPGNAEKIRRNRPRVRENAARIIRAGLPFVLGTDAYHGYLYREVGYAVELGADTVTALQGVTSHAADVCGLGHRLGHLSSGMDADIIAVNGNPLENVSCLSQVGFVMKEGVVFKQM